MATKYFIWTYKSQEVLPEDLKYLMTINRYQNLTLVLNVDGNNPPIATSPNVKFVFPKFK